MLSVCRWEGRLWLSPRILTTAGSVSPLWQQCQHGQEQTLLHVVVTIKSTTALEKREHISSQGLQVEKFKGKVATADDDHASYNYSLISSEYRTSCQNGRWQVRG